MPPLRSAVEGRQVQTHHAPHHDCRGWTNDSAIDSYFPAVLLFCDPTSQIPSSHFFANR